MRCSPVYLAPGFWKRTMQEFTRQANIALKFEAVRVPTRPFDLVQFDDPESRTLCKTMSDRDIGGFSIVNLDYVPDSAAEPSHMRFHGNISIELPPDRPHIQRSGYAAWRTLDRGFTLFGKALWDVDPYHFLALRVKSDGRKYFVNIQTESVVPTDIHQHRLYARTPGEWETVIIPFSEFVRTNHGMVVEPQHEMLRQRVRTVGLGLIDRVPGAFDLSVAGIWATNVIDKKKGPGEQAWGLKQDGKGFELDTDPGPEKRPPKV